MHKEKHSLKDYILRVDGGASKTVVQIVDFSETVVVENINGPSDYKTVGIEITKNNIINGVLGVIKK